MCGRLVNGAWPIHGTPSPPICVKPTVARSIHTTMKWQPMPAIASEPSGTRVLVLCGQPEQNHGRRSVPPVAPAASARSLASRIAEARVHARHDVGRHAELLQPLGDGLAMIAGVRSALARSSQLPLGLGWLHSPPLVALGLVELAEHVRPHVGAPVVELFLQLVLDDLALFLHHQDLAAGPARTRA